MTLLEKTSWFLKNFDDGSFNNLSDEDWNRIESEFIELVVRCDDGGSIQKALALDVDYEIPFDVRLSLHRKLVELEPDNVRAIRDYAFYLDAFGEPSDELLAQELLKRIEGK